MNKKLLLITVALVTVGTVAWFAWARQARAPELDAQATIDNVRSLIESGKPPPGQEARYATQPLHGSTAQSRVMSLMQSTFAQSDEPAVGTSAPAPVAGAGSEIDWLELMPEEDIRKLREIPAVDHSGFVSAEQFMSFNTVKEIDGRQGKIAGYIVPIETNDKGELTSFFLVPYFGACIHVPPPPPNQIVYATLAKPIPVPDMYAPQWVEGTMKIERTDNELGASAYTIKVDRVVLWDS